MDDRELHEKLVEALGILANRKPKPLPVENLGSFREICEACFNLKKLYLDQTSFRQINHFAEIIEQEYQYDDKVYIFDHIIKEKTIVGSLPPARCETYVKLGDRAWHIDAAARLTLGIDPRLHHYLSTPAFHKIRERARLLKDISPSSDADSFHRTLTLKDALFWCYEAKEKPFPLIEKAWLKHQETIARGGTLQNPIRAFREGKAKQAKTNLNPKLQHSLHKILIAMAKKHYKYDTESGKREATSKIHNMMELAGLPLDKDTIRTRLQEALEDVNSRN